LSNFSKILADNITYIPHFVLWYEVPKTLTF